MLQASTRRRRNVKHYAARDSQPSCGAGANIMRSACSRDGELRKRGNCGQQLRAFAGQRAYFSCHWNKTNASSLDGTLFIATSVDATQSLVDSSWRWNKINASSRDGTLFVATDVDAKTMQRNALCSVNSQTFRGAETSLAPVRWTANRYSATSRDGALR